MLQQVHRVLKTVALKLRYGKSLVLGGVQTIGKGSRVDIIGKSEMILGKVSTSSNCHLTAAGSGVLKIGRNVFFNRNCICICRKQIEIGDDCIFGPNVVVYDHDHIFSRGGVEKTRYKTSPVIIGSGCWIGAGTTVLRGTIIGKGCVIGAGSVVKGIVPDYSVVKSNRDIIIQPIHD